MAKIWMAGVLAFGLGLGPASAAPATSPGVVAQQAPVRAAHPNVKAWFQRAIERMLDESAHVALAGMARP